MDEFADAADPRDALVPERREVADDLRRGRLLVVRDGGDRRPGGGLPDRDGREPEPEDLGDARVLPPRVEEHDAVDAPLRPPAPVDLALLLGVGDELDHERDPARRELGLDTGDELHEERLEREDPRRARDHEPAGVGARGRERAGSPVRVPAEVGGDPQDPLARRVGDARLPVQRVRDGALRDAGPLRDVGDRDPPC